MAGSVNIKEIKINLSASTKKITEQIARDCAAEIQLYSPVGNTGDYQKGWNWKWTDDGKNAVVYQSDPARASLTHLLEKGHVLMRKGEQVGFARAIPHIHPVFLEYKQLYMKELKGINLRPE